MQLGAFYSPPSCLSAALLAAPIHDLANSRACPPPASQVSQENIPLGPLATLMPLLQMAGMLNDVGIKNALKIVRECQEQLVVLDRSHTIKVQHIQKEYQDFMEQVSRSPCFLGRLSQRAGVGRCGRT